MTSEAIAPESGAINYKKLIPLVTGLILFAVVYFSPAWPEVVDPSGKTFELTREGKGALAIFLLAGTWWVFEVVPIGVTSLLIGLMQAVFLIRPAEAAFKDMMAPSVMFIFGSLVVGMVFTKTGLTRRLAYKMLAIVGERTSMIYLGCFLVTAALTHIMAHTAVAATMFPLLLAIYDLYGEGNKKTKFGKGLFMGMAYVAGAGSIVTLLGAARGAVGLGFYKQITGEEISFFEYIYYMFPVGWIMTIILWGFFLIVCKPEKSVIPGLKEKAQKLNAQLGSLTKNEVVAALIVFGMIAILSLRSFFPELKAIDKSGIILITTVLFFVTGILDIDDLEAIPWNIILLFGGAMSIGFCLWETGAASWLAINWLAMFQEANWFVFVMSITFLVLMLTNFIMNVSAIAISLPVALVIAPYLGVAAEVVVFSALVAAGMPFLLLVGAAPNAIAYEAKQFTSGEFFMYGIPASIILMILIGIVVYTIWPIMGMPVAIPAS
jgi:sodium-dependent dicarboxylate transporter 2/3/5